MVAVDTIEFPPSKGQNKYLLVFQDLFTRWVEVKPLRKADGKAVARALEELILFRWEIPMYLLSDNGKEFDNKVVKEPQGVVEDLATEQGISPGFLQRRLRDEGPPSAEEERQLRLSLGSTSRQRKERRRQERNVDKRESLKN